MKKHLKGMAWWRAYHGLAAHPRWSMTAIRAKATVPEVLAVAVWLMETASRHSERGDVGGFDVEQCAFYLGVPEDRVEAIMTAMRAGKTPWLDGNRIATWDERQPKREDEDAAERKRRSREAAQGHEQSRSVTNVTPEQSREEQRRVEELSMEESAPAAPLAPIRMKLTEEGRVTEAPAPEPRKPRERKKREKLNVSGEGKTPPDPNKPASDALKGSQPQQNGQEPPIPVKSDYIVEINEKADDAAAAWLKDEGVRYLQRYGSTLTAVGAVVNWAKRLNYRHTALRSIFEEAIKAKIRTPIPYIEEAVKRRAAEVPINPEKVAAVAAEHGDNYGQ